MRLPAPCENGRQYNSVLSPFHNQKIRSPSFVRLRDRWIRLREDSVGIVVVREVLVLTVTRMDLSEPVQGEEIFRLWEMEEERIYVGNNKQVLVGTKFGAVRGIFSIANEVVA